MKSFLIISVCLFSLGLMAQESAVSSPERTLGSYIHHYAAAVRLEFPEDTYTYVLEYGAGDARCPYGYIKYHDGVAVGCLTIEEVGALKESGVLELVNYTLVSSTIVGKHGIPLEVETGYENYIGRIDPATGKRAMLETR
jgi:hypothetical protein